MFEIYPDPSARELMRFAAWQRQQEAVRLASDLSKRFRRDVTFSHYTAAALLGVPVPGVPDHIQYEREFLGHRKSRMQMQINQEEQEVFVPDTPIGEQVNQDRTDEQQSKERQTQISVRRMNRQPTAGFAQAESRPEPVKKAETDAVSEIPRHFRPEQKIHIIHRNKTRRCRLFGVTAHYSNNADEFGSTVEVYGLLCSSPEFLFTQMASYLSLDQLIEFGDSLICRDALLRRTTKEDLYKYVESCQRMRGSRKCRQALKQMRENTDSPRETQLRLIMVRSGLPNPSINFPVSPDAPFLRQRLQPQPQYFLDMAYPAFRVGVEYNGLHHHDQWADDWQRFNSLQSVRWHIFVAENNIIDNPSKTVIFIKNIQHALILAGWDGRFCA